jgi:hypothetical protein
MKTFNSETLDLALTQAIEQYIEMEPNEVHEAIHNDWPEQIAVLLVEFFFKTTCGNDCTAIPDFIEIERDNGHSHYVVLQCSCDLRLPFGGGL